MAAIATQQPTSPPSPAGLSRWAPSLPTGLISMLNPFSTDSSPKQPSDTPNAPETLQRPSRLALLPDGPPSPSKSEMSMLMFAEPDTRSASEADSREGSIDGSKPSKKLNRRKTRYSVCHAPPTSSTRQKLHRRPRSLLQLHKLTVNARPLPAFEVVPSANFNIRLTHTITKVFKARHSLCPNDLVVLRAEDYSNDKEDEESEARAVIGLICKGRKEEGAVPKAKICFMDGTEWDACPMANGGYEFSTVDEHGLTLTARWVPKRNKDGSKPKERKFNFSTVSPNTRRHPVIANLSRTRLEINDLFKLPERSSATPLLNPIESPKLNSNTTVDSLDEEGDSVARPMCETDSKLRELIAMTGIWVTFKEGWSPTFRYEDPKEIGVLQRSGSMQHSPGKSTTSLVSTPPASPRQLPLAHDKRSNSIKSISSSFLSKGKGSLRGKPGNRTSIMSTKSIEEVRELETQRDEQPAKTGRARADSNSTVLVHRAASNRTKNNHQAVWRPDLLNAQQSVTERSREVSRESSRASRNPSPRTSPVLDNQSDKASTPNPQKRNISSGTAETNTASPRTSRPATPVQTQQTDDGKPENRGSTTTDETSTSIPQKTRINSALKLGGGSGTTSASTANGKVKTKTKKRRWRRFLCGSADDDDL